jgi:3-phenylpropionate/cinnamic acid dioxygenase small subunit
MNDSIGVKRRIEDFVLRSALLIDNNQFEQWLGCFDDESRYIVMPRDNKARGLPVALMHCENKARLTDRINCLLYANKTNPHFDRHIVSGSLITDMKDDVAHVQSSFLVVQTNLSGASKLFCAGIYEDKIRLADNGEKLVERCVVVDSFSIPTMLATPL